jgi:hypothetical protein
MLLTLTQLGSSGIREVPHTIAPAAGQAGHGVKHNDDFFVRDPQNGKSLYHGYQQFFVVIFKIIEEVLEVMNFFLKHGMPSSYRWKRKDFITSCW